MDEFSLPYIPGRVISLVPSLTESLFDLGLGGSLVGATDYCIYPDEPLRKIPRVGKVRGPRLEDILRLQPDLILANQEENDRETIEKLAQAGIPVWVTFPRTCRQVIEDLWKLTGIFRNDEAGMRVRSLELSLEWAELAIDEEFRMRYFCPIWQENGEAGEWWMTFNRDTYSHDLLRLFGGKNIFSERDRRYPIPADVSTAIAEEPGDRDVRYPRVSLAEIRKNQPDVILLPDEPFVFSGKEVLHFQDLFPEVPVKCVEGTLLTWPGTRLGKAIEQLSDIFA
jgi:iron complex transport system substrate-binding protein